MMNYELFNILDEAESTNNYAMAQVHEDMAIDGQAWYAYKQWNGKGQRGKKWVSNDGENIILTVLIKPNKVFLVQPFYLSALVANCCRAFFQNIVNVPTKVKWPNDIFCNDRKAGGILIENIYTGQHWQWAAIGIGININQTVFDAATNNPISIKNITGLQYDPLLLAKQLYKNIMETINEVTDKNLPQILINFNKYLYKKEEVVTLKKDIATFKTSIIAVNEYGQLLCKDVIDRAFDVGEVEWVGGEK